MRFFLNLIFWQVAERGVLITHLKALARHKSATFITFLNLTKIKEKVNTIKAIGFTNSLSMLYVGTIQESPSRSRGGSAP